MKSVDRLVAEHDIIERGLNVLETAVSRIESGRAMPDNFPKWAPGFFAQFADKCHHAKEEDLFSRYSRNGALPRKAVQLALCFTSMTLAVIACVDCGK